MPKPAISVLLSTYNGADFLAASLESVLAQDWPDFELLVVDDRSCDDTWGMLERLDDARVRVTRNSVNRGLFFNLNHMIGEARGELVKPWSQDDRMHPQLLRRGWEFYRRHPQTGCFYANCRYLEADGSVSPPPADATPELLPPAQADLYSFCHGCLSPNISNLFLPAAVLGRVGGFDERRIAADFDLMVRIQEHLAVGRISEPSLDVRRHPRQWSRDLASTPKFVRDDVHLYRILLARVVDRHGSMDATTARRMLLRKFAAQHFHGVIHLLLRRRLSDARQSIKAQTQLFSPMSLFVSWLGSLARRIMPGAGRP